MDGTPTETERMRKVVRRFESARLETQRMTTAYEWVLPWMRCGDGAGGARPAQGEAGPWGETGVAVRRRATGA